MMVQINKNILNIIIFYCSLTTVFSMVRLQSDINNDHNKVLKNLLYNNYEKAEISIKNLPESEEKVILNWHFNASINGVLDSVEIEVEKNESGFIKVLKFLKNGKIRQSLNSKKDSIIIINLFQAHNISKEIEDDLVQLYVLRDIIDYLYIKNEDLALITPYLEEVKKLATTNQDLAFYQYYTNILESHYNKRDTSKELKEAYLLIENSDNFLLKANILQMIGVFESYFNSNQNEALNYWKQAAKNYEMIPGFSKMNNLFGIYNNIAVVYSRLDMPQDAFDYYAKTKNNKPENKPLQTAYVYQGLAELHRKVKNIDSSFYYLEEEKKSLKTYYDNNSKKEMRNLLIKYQTAEKEKQILVEQQKVRTNRNWLIAAGIVLLLGAGIALLLQKNTTKKRLLAEQEALLKQERVDNLLKEQELVSIDAMIAGQEKERQRVANELHDDLGSLMATIKLHFDNSKVSKKDPGLQNAQKLLDQAYQKVRSMAHSKNSGVMSDQGLLPAIKKMALVITETNALEVVVEAFGMGDRLENSLELNLFRMVQELVANTIKHAEATKVTIQLTQHEDNLNIIIEDNGKGFDRSKIETDKTGMGLTTIEKRVEHLEGNFTIDSILGKGTSILIDIPV